MNQSKFFYLGKITRKFSFKGELIIFLDTDSPSTYYDLKKVYVKEDDSYLPYFISEISKYKNNSVRVKFEDIENESMAIDSFSISSNFTLTLLFLYFDISEIKYGR